MLKFVGGQAAVWLVFGDDSMGRGIDSRAGLQNGWLDGSGGGCLF